MRKEFSSARYSSELETLTLLSFFFLIIKHSHCFCVCLPQLKRMFKKDSGKKAENTDLQGAKWKERDNTIFRGTETSHSVHLQIQLVPIVMLLTCHVIVMNLIILQCAGVLFFLPQVLSMFQKSR